MAALGMDMSLREAVAYHYLSLPTLTWSDASNLGVPGRSIARLRRHLLASCELRELVCSILSLLVLASSPLPPLSIVLSFDLRAEELLRASMRFDARCSTACHMRVAWRSQELDALARQSMPAAANGGDAVKSAGQ